MGSTRTGPQRGATNVEFLAPDVQRFGGTAAQSSEHWAGGQPRFGDDRPGSRWTMAVAGIGVAALIVAGVIAAAPWNGDDDSAPTTNIPGVNADPNEGATVDGARAGLPQAEDLPDGRPLDGNRDSTWTLRTPEDFTPIDTSSQPDRPPGWFQLWTSDGADRTNGRWFAVHVAEATTPSLIADAERVPFEGGTLLHWTSPDGVQQLQFSPSDGYEVRVTAHGWRLPLLYGLVESMSVVDGRPYFRMPGPSPDQLRISRATTAFGLEQEFIGRNRWSFTEWRDSDGARLSLTVAPAQLDSDLVGPFVVTASPDEPTSSGPNVLSNVGWIEATIGRLPGADGRNVIAWTVYGTSFALTGDLPIEQLLDLASTVRPTVGNEWDALQLQVDMTRDSVRSGWVRAAEGLLEDGGPWFADLDVRTGLLSLNVGGVRSVVEVPNDGLRSYATEEGVVVVAVLGSSSGAVALRGSVDDALNVVETQDLVTIGDDLVGAVLLEQFGDYRARIVGPSGQLLFEIRMPTDVSTG